MGEGFERLDCGGVCGEGNEGWGSFDSERLSGDAGSYGGDSDVCKWSCWRLR